MLKIVLIAAFLVAFSQAIPSVKDVWESNQKSVDSASNEVATYIVKTANVTHTKSDLADKFKGALLKEVAALKNKIHLHLLADSTDIKENPFCKLCRKVCKREQLPATNTKSSSLASLGDEAKVALRKMTQDFMTSHVTGSNLQFCCVCGRCRRYCSACGRRCCCNGDRGCRCVSCATQLSMPDTSFLHSNGVQEVENSSRKGLMKSVDKVVDDVIDEITKN